jgi:outer membrane lipoprotein-sorting protein
MGSDFGFEDMSQTSFSPIYDAKIAAEDEKTATLELSAKPGHDLEFPKLRMTIDKQTLAISKIDHQDASGKVLKTQVRDGYRRDGDRDYYSPGRVIMTDHRRNDHTSEIDFTSFKLNSGLSDELFTQRSLIRGN